MSPEIPDSAMAIPGYNPFRSDRTSAPGGGVCIYLRQTIPCTRLSQCEQPDVESLWLSLRPHSLPRSISSIILCVVYHSTANGQPDHFISLTSDFVPLIPTGVTNQQVPPGLLVSVREVQYSLAILNVGKAIGPDMISNTVLKEFAPELAPLIMDMLTQGGLYT